MCPDAEGDIPCPACPAARLETALQSAIGARMRAAFDLDFALGKRIQISLDEIGALEFRALRVIELERRAWQEEKDKERQDEARRGK